MNNTSLTTPGRKVNRFTIFTIVIVLFFLIICAVYYFVWRPSDSDYQKATTQVNKIQNSNDAIGFGLVSIQYAGTISDTTLSNAKKAVDTYRSSVQELSRSPVVARDLKVKSVFDQTNKGLKSLDLSIGNLLTSLELYLSAQDSCNKFIIDFHNTTRPDVDTLAKTCLDALDKMSTSPDSSINSDFFSEYITDTTALVNAYRHLSTAKNDSTAIKTANTEVEQAKNKVSSLGNQKIDYMFLDQTEALAKLLNVIDSQKNTFFR